MDLEEGKQIIERKSLEILQLKELLDEKNRDIKKLI